MGDWPIAELGGLTPLQVAKTPAMDALATQGRVGLVSTTPEGFSPGSDVTNMGILGYNPVLYYTGRSPIEAASMGITLLDHQLTFRCNFITEKEGIMDSFTADHVTTEEASRLIQSIHLLDSRDFVNLFLGVGYRHVGVASDLYADFSCPPPHDILGKRLSDYYPNEPLYQPLLDWIESVKALLAHHTVNQERIQAGKKPANAIWLWGQGKMPVLPSFKDQTGLTGGVVTAVDLIKGLGKLAGLEVPTVEGATGFVDTNYQGKWQAAVNLLNQHDFVFVHVEAPDEAGHMGDWDLKIRAIEDFDRYIVQAALDYLKLHPQTRIWVLPDHFTPCERRTHSLDLVPYVMAGAGVVPDTATHYTEAAVKQLAAPYEGAVYQLASDFLTSRCMP